MSNKEFEGDAGAPLPDFSGARNISLTTVAPALGVKGQAQPDYLDFDQKGRGTVVTMFANSGTCYLMGIVSGGLYGLQKGITSTQSSKFKVKVNSVLNNAGRYGSRAGNSLGVVAVLYSLYEGLADNVSAIKFECLAIILFLFLVGFLSRHDTKTHDIFPNFLHFAAGN